MEVWRCDLLAQYNDMQSEILKSVERVLDSGRYTLADEVLQFENEFAKYLGSNYCLGVANATDGLVLALKSLGIQPGDEVITTPFTAIPTVSAIVLSGARPVFVDIDPETYLITSENILKAITPKTKAIMPVHIFGNVFDVKNLAQKLPSHISIVEDSAQAHGCTIDGHHAGTLGRLGVFSFYPTKNLGGYGDGGAIVTNEKELCDNIRLLRQYGMTDKDHIITHGQNSRLDEIQAAILRVKLKRLDSMNAKRNEIADLYRSEISDKNIQFQKINPNVVSNYHVFSGRVQGDRNKLMKYLEANGIQSNVYYLIPLHLQQANKYLGYKLGDLPVAEKLCNEVVALPMYAELPPAHLEKIIFTLKTFFKDN